MEYQDIALFLFACGLFYLLGLAHGYHYGLENQDR